MEGPIENSVESSKGNVGLVCWATGSHYSLLSRTNIHIALPEGYPTVMCAGIVVGRPVTGG